MYARSRVDESDKALSAALPRDSFPEPSRREIHEKRAGLIECNAQVGWKGERIAACATCGRVFLASALRLTREHPRLLCRSCYQASRKHLRP
jgi:hypothetical protein